MDALEVKFLGVKLMAINHRLHALEQVFISLYPDKKQEMEAIFTKGMREQIELLKGVKGTQSDENTCD